MANKKRRILAWVTAMAIIAGQLAIPTAATEEDTIRQNVGVSVDVAANLPEVPGAESQVPAAGENMTVTTSDPETTTNHDVASGAIEESTSTTTNWSGEVGDTIITGTETTTTVVGTDDYTGDTLYEGGTTAGSETRTTETESVTGTTTEEGFVTKEIITETNNTQVNENGSEAIIGGESKEEGTADWNNTEGGFTQGQFEVDNAEDWSDSETTILGEESLTNGGVTIGLSGSGNAYTGSVNGEVIPLEEGVTIPEGAVLVKDEEGNVIGYTFSTTTQTITGTTTKEGEAQKDEANSSTDTTGTTVATAPESADIAAQAGYIITDNTVITEEKDASGNVTAYTLTTTEEEIIDLKDVPMATKPESAVNVRADGSIEAITSEDILDAAGNVIGFTSRRIVTDAEGNVIQDTTTTQTVIEPVLPQAAAPVVKFILPEKPAESAVTENGVTTTITVSEIRDESDNVIGYKSTTVRADEDGAELFRGEEDIFGTKQTVTESVTVTNPQEGTNDGTMKRTVTHTARVTAEETTFQDIAAYTRLNEIVNEMTVDKTNEVVMVDGKLYYIYTGSVNVTEGANHGNTTMMEPLDIQESLFKENSALDLSSGGGDLNNTSKPAEGYKYIGYGIDTALSISKGNSSSDVVQFRLKGANGKEYYALCIDFNTSIQQGHLYDIADLSSEDYYQQDGIVTVESADKLRIIALNGYWGTADDNTTDNDIGSLDEVKGLLRSYLTAQGTLSENQINSIVDSLTPGQALAATQAALWKYGNINGNKKVNEDNLVPNGWDESGKGIHKTYTKNEDYINTEYLYDALLALANDPNTQLEVDEGVEFLDAEDITATSIVVKEKVASNDSGNVYKTDLNFTLGIEPTKLIGDLKVTVYDSNGKSIKTVILANSNKDLIGLKPDANGVYTIPDIEIAEGVNVNLKLHGTQDLGTGVYIYTSLHDERTDSQTLVTLATGSRTVDLDIAMRLDVQEPTVTRESSGETQYGTRTDTQAQTKTVSVQRKKTTHKVDTSTTTHEEVETSKVFTADVTLTEVTTEETSSKKSWIFSWLKEFAPEGDPYNGDNGWDEGGDDGVHIRDEEVPLAAAPKTGDISPLWAAMSLMSMSGAVLLARKKEEE